jgi:uncharacterized repeat protein (TIGR03803 family)
MPTWAYNVFHFLGRYGNSVVAGVEMTNARHRQRFLTAIWRGAARAAFGITTFLAPAIIAATQAANAQTYTVLYAFKGAPDGQAPGAGVTLDKKGNIYGTTLYAGSSRNCTGGCGSVFKLSRYGKEVVLHSFVGYPNDGERPEAGVILDTLGNVYGTTEEFGGTVYRVNKGGKSVVLHAFVGYPTDGQYPFAPLVMDDAGSLYGTAVEGGVYNGGVVFKLDKDGKETLLHSFDGSDGISPWSGLVRDAVGTLYGTAAFGGHSNCYPSGCGTVYKLDKSGRFTLLYSFSGGNDGNYPFPDLTRDTRGNLYGVTTAGGDPHCSGTAFGGCGVVFKLSPHGKFTVLHTFTGTDGKAPRAGLVLDKMGNLYGTAAEGGIYGHGTLFKVPTKKAPWRLTVLHNFAGGADGAEPYGDLIWDETGNLYSTTAGGGDVTCISSSFGDGCGTVFRFTPLAGQRR